MRVGGGGRGCGISTTLMSSTSTSGDSEPNQRFVTLAAAEGRKKTTGDDGVDDADDGVAC
jgi:hypothetical protein